MTPNSVSAEPAAGQITTFWWDAGAGGADEASAEIEAIQGALTHTKLDTTLRFNTSAAATDTIDYVATDTWRNTATSTRTIIIEPAATNGMIASLIDSSTEASSTIQ
jgi:hypothetical protein